MAKQIGRTGSSIDKTSKEAARSAMETGQAEGAGQQGRNVKNLCGACNRRDMQTDSADKGGRQAELKQTEHEINMQT